LRPRRAEFVRDQEADILDASRPCIDLSLVGKGNLTVALRSVTSSPKITWDIRAAFTSASPVVRPNHAGVIDAQRSRPA
jgi:hypothetical protein